MQDAIVTVLKQLEENPLVTVTASIDGKTIVIDHERDNGQSIKFSWDTNRYNGWHTRVDKNGEKQESNSLYTLYGEVGAKVFISMYQMADLLRPRSKKSITQ